MKNILTLPTLVIGLLSQNSIAQEQLKFVSPQTVNYILNDAYLNIPRSELLKIISEKELLSLENYSHLDKNQIYANAYLAAAVGGAAAAAVDYVWNKYVNSHYVNTDKVDDRYFDLIIEEASISQIVSLDGPVFPHQPVPIKAFAVSAHGGSDPVALTPAAAGTALAATIAYNASRWGLKKAFGDPNHEVLNLDEKQFDLSYQ